MPEPTPLLPPDAPPAEPFTRADAQRLAYTMAQKRVRIGREVFEQFPPSEYTQDERDMILFYTEDIERTLSRRANNTGRF